MNTNSKVLFPMWNKEREEKEFMSQNASDSTRERLK